MGKIADFTDADRWAVETALKERYGRIASVTPRLQADRQKNRAGATTGKTGAELKQ